MLALAHVRRKRGCGARPQLEPESEITNDLFRKKAHEIRVAGEMGGVVRKNPLRSGRSADVIVFLQQQDTQTGAGEVRGGYQPVVPCAEDNDVVFGLQLHY